MLTDTHCHIHDADYPLPVDEVLARAKAAGVTRLICVGTSEDSSSRAVEFAETYDNIWAAIGVHPHDTKDGYGLIAKLAGQVSPKLVAVGEIGLDYFYGHSPREVQIQALESQLQTAFDHDLPVIFHVREAFDDFWPILGNFPKTRGVLHSFTDNAINLERAFERGLYVGVNGISTFTKQTDQRDMFRQIPLDRLLLETDAPFLTPAPIRGTINEPAFVELVAKYHADARGVSVDDVAAATTANAIALFGAKLNTDI